MEIVAKKGDREYWLIIKIGPWRYEHRLGYYKTYDPKEDAYFYHD